MKLRLGPINFMVWSFFIRKVLFAWRHVYNPESLTWPVGFLQKGRPEKDSYEDEVLASIGISSMSEWQRFQSLETSVRVQMEDLLRVIEGWSNTTPVGRATKPMNELRPDTRASLPRIFVSLLLNANTTFTDADAEVIIRDIEERLAFRFPAERPSNLSPEDNAHRARMKALIDAVSVALSVTPPVSGLEGKMRDDIEALIARRNDRVLRLFYYLFCFTRILITGPRDELTLPSFDVFRPIPPRS